MVVLEQHAYPRDKVCGDALIADSIRVLKRAELLANVEMQSYETKSLRLYSPSDHELVISCRTLVIKRIEFDALLAQAAARAGVAVAQAHVASVTPGELALIAVRGDRDVVKAKVALIATGANIRLLPALGMMEQPAPTVVAVRRYIRSTAHIEQLIFKIDRAIAPGYAWLFPLGNGVYNVGCGATYGGKRVDLAKALNRFINDFAPLKNFAKGITYAEPMRGAVLRCGLRGTAPWRPPNVLAIGETIGTTFPFTGEGIGKAMETGERAAHVVARALATHDLTHLASYVTELDALRLRYRGYELAEQWLARPWLADMITLLARRSPHAIASAEAVLNETADPREIFSMRGLWKMLRA